ncbi:hypothetical protein [Thalassospira lucentensis]|uniref:hypothetical protein n=1 Tax=Thalassospira lucentensis TaxID=168935 RepID=UPI0029424698|nr:hypothetical protein [Thalassospira lucentensis]WOI10938.1 hypothetical protein R1T41_20855 [Thalassospira lucentensis]
MKLKSLALISLFAASLMGCKHTLTPQQLNTLEGREIYFAKVGSPVDHDPNQTNFGLDGVSTATRNKIANGLSEAFNMKSTSEIFYLSEDDFNMWDGFDQSYLKIIEENPQKVLTGILIQTGYLGYNITDFGGWVFDKQKIVELQLPVHIVDMQEKKRIGYSICKRTYVVYIDELDQKEKHLPVYNQFSKDCSTEILSFIFGLNFTT